MPGMGTLPGPTNIPDTPSGGPTAPSLGNSGSVPTYEPGRDGPAGGSAVPAAIEAGAANPATSMDAADAAIADAAAARMESQGGAPASLPTAYSLPMAAIHQAQAQYGPMVSVGGPPVGGEQTGQNIGALLAALGVK